MLERMLYFVNCLRMAGLRVSLDQLIIALEALVIVGLQQEIFHTVLRSIFAKTRQEIVIFEKVYGLCFGMGESQLTISSISIPSEGLALKIRGSGCDGRGLGRSGTGPSQGDFLLSLLDGAGLERLAKASVEALVWDETLPQSVGAYWEKIKQELDWHMLLYEVEQRLEVTEGERHLLKERLDYFANRVEQRLYKKIALLEGDKGVERLLKELNYQEQDFNDLNEFALTMVEQQVKKLGRRLASRKGYRLQRSLRGRIDLKKTLHLAATRGGVPLELRRQRRRPKHPELMVLCDISNSMARHTHFMLLLIWALQTKHKRIRSFVFVDQLAEVTGLLQEPEALNKLKFIGIYAPCSATGYTDYGRVFVGFVEKYLDQIGPRVKILVLGDGKNNWRDPQAEALKAISHKSGGIYWLNPREREHWYGLDSVLAQYQCYCKEVYKCSNLLELQQVAAHIF